MEVKDYRTRKQAGQIEFRARGNGQVIAFAAKYDPGTGEKLPDDFSDLNLKGLENDRANLVASIEHQQGLLADLDALIADVTKADEAFSKADKKK